VPRLTDDLARELGGTDDGAGILSGLCRNNFFTTTDGRGGFEYHPLFREFLLSMAKVVFTREALASLRREAVSSLLAAGRVDEAATLAVEAEDWQGLERIVIAHAPELLREGRHRTLEGWLLSAPAGVLRGNPWLLYWLGMAILPNSLGEARARFEAAFRDFTRLDDVAGSYLAWCGIVDTFIYETGDFKPLEGWLAEAEALRRRHPRCASPDIEARFTYAMFCACVFSRSGDPDLPRWEDGARQVALGSGDLQLRTTLSVILIWYLSWWKGDLASAGVLIAALRDAALALPGSPFIEIAWRSAEAAHCFQTADVDRCETLVHEGLARAQAAGMHLFDFSLAQHGGWACLNKGDAGAAAGYLNQMSPVVLTNRTTDIALHHLALGWKAMLEREFALASEHAQTGFDLLRKAGFTMAASSAALLRAEPRIELGDLDGARALLDEGWELARSARVRTCEHLGWYLEALWALRKGDARLVLEALRRHLKLGSETGLMNHFWWRSSPVSELYAMALEAGIESDHVRAVIRKRGLAAPSGTLVHGWPNRLEIRILGSFELHRDGKDVELGRKPPRKGIELLQALIAFGAEVPMERLADCLWPGADGDSALHALETTQYRLRRLLGSEIVRQRGRMVGLDRASCWADVPALEQQLSTAFSRLGSSHLVIEQVRGDVERVFALYRGPLLADLDEEWVRAPRDRLRAKVGRYLRRAAELLSRSGGAPSGSEILSRAQLADQALPLGEDGAVALRALHAVRLL
jgi:hypothetical protein